MGFTHTIPSYGGLVKGYFGSGTYSAAVTGASSANTYGAWVEMSSGIDFDADRVILTMISAAAVDLFLFDIGVGAVGSEEVLVPEIPYQVYDFDAVLDCVVYDLPVRIVEGTRVSLRCKSLLGGSHVAYVAACMVCGASDAIVGTSGVVPVGISGATSNMTEVDPGGTSGTYGSYVELTSSLSDDIRGWILCVGSGANSSTSTAGWLVTVGVGASGSEVPVVDGWPIHANASGITMANPEASPIFPIQIKAGSRIAVKLKCSITDSTDRKLRVGMLGFK